MGFSPQMTHHEINKRFTSESLLITCLLCFYPLAPAHKIVQLKNLLIMLDVLHLQNMFGHDHLHSLVHMINKMPLVTCRIEAHLQKLLLCCTQVV